jgi:hypothetical protein
MKITTAHPPGSRRGRARGAGQTIATLASCALLITAAACSSGNSSAAVGGSRDASRNSSSTAGSTQSQQDLAYAQCMRSHGVADFPDPNPGGGFGGSISSEILNNPDYATADSSCRHLLPGAGTGNKVQQNESAFLQHARCMRSHGVPNYPDPNPGVNPRTALQQAGINVNSPQVQAASRVCDRLLPSRGAGS